MLRNFVSLVAIAAVLSAGSAFAQCASCGSSMPVYSTPISSSVTYAAPVYYYSDSQPTYTNVSGTITSAPINTGCGGCNTMTYTSSSCGCGQATYTAYHPVSSSCGSCNSCGCASTACNNGCGGCRRVMNRGCCNTGYVVSNCSGCSTCGGCNSCGSCGGGCGQMVSGGCVGCANSVQAGTVVGEAAAPVAPQDAGSTVEEPKATGSEPSEAGNK